MAFLTGSSFHWTTLFEHELGEQFGNGSQWEAIAMPRIQFFCSDIELKPYCQCLSLAGGDGISATAAPDCLPSLFCADEAVGGPLLSQRYATSGGRVIKTLGDSVLFVAEKSHVAAEIALRLIELHARAKGLPELRVGLASGPVIWRMGDVFGTTVNLASRLTALALPGTILADPALAEELEGDRAFLLRPVSRLSVRGLGELAPFTVVRAGAT
ncbi:adenylate/guanylate cyclase domain-containing protein [Nonomuraea sp. NPDC049480]|uniref:adenylate/guanylate cyclase domain-containing protein n=1 Tax=Nonomuraea sp. NPDC049480 TaxID=3364353 RepID=UPI00379E1AB1